MQGDEPMSRLERFREAQNSPYAGYESALEELRTGGKKEHWIWYVFPQLEGLGGSHSARYYAISGADEAADFLRDAELRSRLLTVARAVAEALSSGRAPSLEALMGAPIDALKVVSSLTLFRHVAMTLDAVEHVDEYAELARVADAVLAIARSEGYPPCSYTLGRLRGTP